MALLAVDDQYDRLCRCTLTVPYGGRFELPNYRYEVMNVDWVPAEHRFGAGPLRELELVAPISDINVALQRIAFHPDPGYFGSAYIEVVRLGLAVGVGDCFFIGT